MHVEDIHSVKAGYGTILVKPIKDNNYIHVGDTKVYLDTSYQREKHSVTYGEVVSVCDTIDDSLRTTIEVRKGDIVYFHYNCTLNAIRDKKYLVCNKEVYYSVSYESLYVAKRINTIDHIICLNGYILVTPVLSNTEDRIGNILLPDCMMREEQVSRGRVAFTGNPLNGEKQLVNPGVNIIFRKSSAVPIQYGLHASFDGDNKYFRMKNDSILAIDK